MLVYVKQKLDMPGVPPYHLLTDKGKLRIHLYAHAFTPSVNWILDHIVILFE